MDSLFVAKDKLQLLSHRVNSLSKTTRICYLRYNLNALTNFNLFVFIEEDVFALEVPVSDL